MSESAEAAKNAEIIFNKELRCLLDGLIQRLRIRSGSPERTLAFRAMQMARHWLGEDLAILGAKNPYPNGSNVGNIIVDPAADQAIRRSGSKPNGPSLDGFYADIDRQITDARAKITAVNQRNAGDPVKDSDECCGSAKQAERQIAAQEKDCGCIRGTVECKNHPVHPAWKDAEPFHQEKSKETGLEPNFNVGIDSPVKRDDHGQPA